MMAEYQYTLTDRLEQLTTIQPLLEALILHLYRTGQFRDKARIYERILREARRIEAEGFEEDEVIKLGKAIPDLFSRHKDWLPPLNQDEDGKWAEAGWFIALEEYLQPVLESAWKLRTLGYTFDETNR